MKNIPISKAMLIAACAVAMLSCNVGSESYDIPVSWNISGVATCTANVTSDQAVTFDAMRVQTISNETQQTVDDATNIPCNTFEYTIPDLDEGDYTVIISAFATYNNEYLPFFRAKAVIEAPLPSGANYSFPLMLGTSDVKIVWGFTEIGNCAVFGVNTVSIELKGMEKNPNYILTFNNVSCDAPGQDVEDLPWDTYMITVKGFAGDELTYQGVVGPTELKPNDEVVQIPVELIKVGTL